MAQHNPRYDEAQTMSALSNLGQIRITLSVSNTLALLGDAVQETQSLRGQAAAILSRLQQLNSTLASEFRFKEDVISQLPFCMLCSVPAPATILSFIVVSYCWHYPDWKMATAAAPIVPGWEISRPMMEAVMGARKSAAEGVWLDRICINQTDESNKKLHINAMDAIYRSARRMVILLEDVQLNQSEGDAGQAYADFYADCSREIKDRNLTGQEKADFFHGYFPSCEKRFREEGREHILSGGRAFARKLLRARWHERAWCAHESRVAPHRKVDNPLFFCYDQDGQVLQFEFRFVHYISMYLANGEHEKGWLDPAEMSALPQRMNDPNPTSLQELWWRLQRHNPDFGGRTSAMQHLVSILSFKCSVKNDLMCIALNTSGIPLSFNGHVSSDEDILWRFSLLVLAAGDATPLIMDGVKLRTNGISGQTRVSWISRPTQTQLDDVVPGMSANSITAVTRDFIELDLLVVKTLPKPPTAESLAKAAQIIEDYMLDAVANSIQDTSPNQIRASHTLLKEVEQNIKNGRPGPLHVFLQTWIASGLDNGLNWILRFPRAMEEATHTCIYGTIGEEIDIRLTNAAAAIISHFGSAEQTGLLSSLERTNSVIRFLTAIVDPRLKFFTTSPRRVQCSQADFFMTASISNRSWVSIPVAVAHLPSWQKQAWIIEPFDPSTQPENPEDHLAVPNTVIEPGQKAEDVFPVLSSDYADQRTPRDDERASWRVRTTQRIFGGSVELKTLVDSADDKFIVLLPRQRIYGAENYDWRTISAVAKTVKDAPNSTSNDSINSPEDGK